MVVVDIIVAKDVLPSPLSSHVDLRATLNFITASVSMVCCGQHSGGRRGRTLFPPVALFLASITPSQNFTHPVHLQPRGPYLQDSPAPLS